VSTPTTFDVVDWSDDAYKNHGGEYVVATVKLPQGLTGFSYDGGRLDLNGHPETIWVTSHQFSVRLKEPS
jgi:hypothetical protein